MDPRDDQRQQPAADGPPPSTRIDRPHSASRDLPQPATIVPRRKPEGIAASSVKGIESRSLPAEAPRYVAEPDGALPEIVVQHADDLSLHLAGRLREVERRELAQAEYQARLHEAEAAARLWVAQRDQELSQRERELALRESELATSAAALAAAEIAAEQEQANQRAALQQQREHLDRRRTELNEREQHLALTEKAALAQATQEHRLALENRWIAGQLWSRLSGSGLASDDQLQAALGAVRGQLAAQFRRERETLEQLRRLLTREAPANDRPTLEKST